MPGEKRGVSRFISFPGCAWECERDALRPFKTVDRHETQSVWDASPRRARERCDIFIEIYPHIIGWGNTPSFELIQGRDAHYYNYFSDQFEALWQRAKDWQPTNSP